MSALSMPELLLRAGFCCLVSAALAPGQCTNPWVSPTGVAGVAGTVTDLLVFDPDGPGPLGERVLVAGDFDAAGDLAVENLAVFDPASRSWSAFGPGPYPPGMSVAQDANGVFYFVGGFTSIAGVAANHVAAFDGVSWSALGTGTNNVASFVEVASNGDVVVGGIFDQAGGGVAGGVATWNGTSWSGVPYPAAGWGWLTSLAVAPNGDIWAGVEPTSGPSLAYRFDGTSWVQLGGSFGSMRVQLVALANGDVVVGANMIPGNFTGERVARWNGTGWVPLSGSPFLSVSNLVEMPGGQLLGIGAPSPSSQLVLAIWDGAVWSVIGEGREIGVPLAPPPVAPLASGQLLVGGRLQTMQGQPVRSLAFWDGLGWSAPGPGLGFFPSSVAAHDGEIFVVNGEFVRRWSGLGWLPVDPFFGTGCNGVPIRAHADRTRGLLLAVSTQGTNCAQLLRKGTSNWSVYATSSSGTGAVADLATTPDDHLIVGGTFQDMGGVVAHHVARHDGTGWAPLGAGLAAPVRAVACGAGGEIFGLTGLLTATSYAVSQFDGTSWGQVGPNLPGWVRDLVVDRDGAPIVVGDFPGADVLRWDGVSWAPLGSGPAGVVTCAFALPNGDLVVGPGTEWPYPLRDLERWDGQQWTSLGTIDGAVAAMAQHDGGDLLVAGGFFAAGGQSVDGFARLSTSCPATANVVHAGCSFDLEPDGLPWLDTTFRSILVTSSPFALLVTGLSSYNLPLASLAPTQGPCLLVASPDVVQIGLPAGNRVDVTLPIPNVPGLLGATFRQQAVAVDVVGVGFALRGSNALEMSIGRF